MTPIRSVYLDCEFLPGDPTTAGLVSIGLTDDQGRDYYAVNDDMDRAAVLAVQWMVDNVWPSLPLTVDYRIDRRHQDVKDTATIRREIAAYFADTDAETTRLYAWYGGQDIGRLHSLWDNDWSVMPDEIPRWFTEIEALIEDAGRPEMPVQEAGHHNALADAHHNRVMHEFLLDRVLDARLRAADRDLRRAIEAR